MKNLLAVFLTFALFVLSSQSYFTAQEQQPEKGSAPDCSKWQIRGLKIGMTIQEAQSAGVKPKQRDLRDLAPEGGGAYWWIWKEDLWKWKFHYLSTGGKEKTSPVVSLIIALGKDAPQPDKTLEALIENWGEPDLKSAPTTMRLVGGPAATGTTAGLGTWASHWVDQACGVEAWFIEKKDAMNVPPQTFGTALLDLAAPGTGNHTQVFTTTFLRLDSLSLKEEQKEKAKATVKDLLK